MHQEGTCGTFFVCLFFCLSLLWMPAWPSCFFCLFFAALPTLERMTLLERFGGI